jgi:sortase A
VCALVLLVGAGTSQIPLKTSLTMRDQSKIKRTALLRYFRVELILFMVGFAMLAFCLGARIYAEFWSHASIVSFEESRKGSSTVDARSDKQDNSRFDFNLWSSQRIEAYKQSLAQHFEPPVAVLRVEKIHLEVPVLEGTDDLTLNRGVGRISGTARPGEDGNIGIAGHRDGFFRGLKDVKLGDRMELVTTKEADIYVVDKVEVVTPDNVSVLRATSTPTLTLVTCYPFYFIGSAPQRYIVHASIVAAARSSGRARTNSPQENSQRGLDQFTSTHFNRTDTHGPE